MGEGWKCISDTLCTIVNMVKTGYAVYRLPYTILWSVYKAPLWISMIRLLHRTVPNLYTCIGAVLLQ